MFSVHSSCEILANISRTILEVLPKFRERSLWTNWSCIRWGLVESHWEKPVVQDVWSTNDYTHYITPSAFRICCGLGYISCKCWKNVWPLGIGLTSTSSAKRSEGLSQHGTGWFPGEVHPKNWETPPSLDWKDKIVTGHNHIFPIRNSLQPVHWQTVYTWQFVGTEASDYPMQIYQKVWGAMKHRDV